jgi:hypothetical protein
VSFHPVLHDLRDLAPETLNSLGSSFSAVVKEAVHITVSLRLPYLLHVLANDVISAGCGTRCRPGSTLRAR